MWWKSGLSHHSKTFISGTRESTSLFSIRFAFNCLPECNEKLSRSDLFHVSSFHLNRANVHEFSKTVRDYSTIFVIAANIEWKLQANYIVNIAPNPLDWSSIRERAQNLWKHFFFLQSEHILISVSELKLIKSKLRFFILSNFTWQIIWSKDIRMCGGLLNLCIYSFTLLSVDSCFLGHIVIDLLRNSQKSDSKFK